MPSTFKYYAYLVLCAVLLTSCGHTLKSESGLYNVTLESSPKLPVKGYWLSGTGKRINPGTSGLIYLAPLNVKAISKKYPLAARQMRENMHKYLVTELNKALAEINSKNHTNWQITTTPTTTANARIDMAVVHFKPQRPILRVLVEILSFWSPVPMTSTLMSPASSGDICLECTVKNVHTGELLLAFKDENRKKPRYVNKEAYSRDGNADANLEFWAKRLAFVIRESAYDKSGTKTLKQRVNDMNAYDAAKIIVDDTLEDVNDTVEDVSNVIQAL
ncbi:MAG: hypothetical protein IKZ13_02500 [Akkermansia sp.]|nr:hypothetical protein [Akkermansia sp.]